VRAWLGSGTAIHFPAPCGLPEPGWGFDRGLNQIQDVLCRVERRRSSRPATTGCSFSDGWIVSHARLAFTLGQIRAGLPDLRAFGWDDLRCGSGKTA
jgi:hypothetical protein